MVIMRPASTTVQPACCKKCVSKLPDYSSLLETLTKKTFKSRLNHYNAYHVDAHLPFRWQMNITTSLFRCASISSAAGLCQVMMMMMRAQSPIPERSKAMRIPHSVHTTYIRKGLQPTYIIHSTSRCVDWGVYTEFTYLFAKFIQGNNSMNFDINQNFSPIVIFLQTS